MTIDQKRSGGPRAATLALWLGLALAAWPSPARAWLFHEHRAISARAVEDLDPAHRQALEALWKDARGGYEKRLCSDSVVRPEEKPTCVDLSAWPAIGGDHSCTARDMLATVLDSDWILDVLGVAQRTGAKIASAKKDTAARNAQTIGDIGLQRADKDYATRAGSNNAHFLLPRSSDDAFSYAREALKPGAELNAEAIYLLYHASAMAKASALATGALAPSERSAAARDVLALEAFAAHFLEDSFAAGHIAGSWGKVAERKGTHDYYNEHGLDVENWNHEPMILFGDGHMRDDDLARAGAAVSQSLGQVLDASRAGTPGSRDAALFSPPAEALAGTVDICKASKMPDWLPPSAIQPYAAQVLRNCPIPFRGAGYASLPRFRAEIGSFIGLTSGVSGAGSGGGFTDSGSGGAQSSLDVGVRLGLGLDGLLGDSGDGLIFIQGSFVSQSRSSAGCRSDCPTDPLLLQFAPSVPARTGYQFRVRLPFWLLPGDLVLALPVLGFTDPKALERMAITAVDGGLIPWQTKLHTGFGAFQFVAGREVGATLFGFGTKDSFLAIYDTGSGKVAVPVAIKSIQWEFPLLEYRPFREYGTRYTFSTLVQVGLGFDKPISGVVVGQPDAAPPPFKSRYFGFVRLFFDGRRYY